MADDTVYIAKIVFVNGTERTFEFLPVGDEDPRNFFRRLTETREAGEITLELEDKVITLITANIISVDVTPKPRRIARNAVTVYREH